MLPILIFYIKVPTPIITMKISSKRVSLSALTDLPNLCSHRRKGTRPPKKLMMWFEKGHKLHAYSCIPVIFPPSLIIHRKVWETMKEEKMEKTLKAPYFLSKWFRYLASSARYDTSLQTELGLHKTCQTDECQQLIIKLWWQPDRDELSVAQIPWSRDCCCFSAGWMLITSSWV